MSIGETNRQEKGAISILMAVVIVGLIGAAAFAVDIGYGLVVKSELQNVADTGSLAGTRELALAYQDPNSPGYWGDRGLTDGEKSQIAAKVNEYSALNKAGGVAVTVRTNEDIIYGKYDKATGEFVSADKGVMGIKVTARRDENINGAVQTLLARVLGIQSISIDASSAATLSALKKAPAGKLGIPVGISEFWFKSKNSPCGTRTSNGHSIRLYPTGPQAGETVTTAQGCAGWHTYTEYPASASRLRNILGDLRTDTYVSPATEANVTHFNFTGGVIATAFNDMMQLFNTEKDSDGTWTAVVPVYQSADCSNPSGAIKIVGFATAYIYSVSTGSDRIIDAKVMCNVVDWGEGGGDDYGTLVGRPGMVE